MNAALDKLCEELFALLDAGEKVMVFADERLTLVAERELCKRRGGFFDLLVYSFKKYLILHYDMQSLVVTKQGSAMIIKRVMEKHAGELKSFKKLSSPETASTIFDEISVFHASGISPDDMPDVVDDEGSLLSNKMHDLKLIYGDYENFLASKNWMDVNGYRARAENALQAESLEEGHVIFFGFTDFSHTSSLSVVACMQKAKSVTGIFVGGKEEIYVNEAYSDFMGCAEKVYRKDEISDVMTKSRLCPEAETLRCGLFNPESLRRPPLKTDKVEIFEAEDLEEELEYVAANIKKIIIESARKDPKYREMWPDGEIRYREISVMMPYLENHKLIISRVFSRYNIPYYTDGSLNLSSSSICEFVLSCLRCAAGGYYPGDVDGVVSSPLFNDEKGSITRTDKDIYRNYLMHLKNFRGGAKKQPDENECEKEGYLYESVKKVHDLLIKIISPIKPKGTGESFQEDLTAILQTVGAENTLHTQAEACRQTFPETSQLLDKAYDKCIEVLKEASDITAEDVLSISDYEKIISTGFFANKISVIPPRQDAVFFGDISTTVNAGTKVLFALNLTDGVPVVKNDTGILTESEITRLKDLKDKKINVTPTISQINARAREVTALNLCSFSQKLYLCYPELTDGEPCEPGEIIEYAKALFADISGEKLTPLNMNQAEETPLYPYFCSEKIPALKKYAKFAQYDDKSQDKAAVEARHDQAREIEDVLRSKGVNVNECVNMQDKPLLDISCGDELFMPDGNISPTALEAWFGCPYKGFMERGLSVSERKQGGKVALDCGNFIHAVLEYALNTDAGPVLDKDTVEQRAKEKCDYLADDPGYKAVFSQKSGEYTLKMLKQEAVAICSAAWKQIENSHFKVYKTEMYCSTRLSNGKTISGWTDRADVTADGENVRIIDYKTGSFSTAGRDYYMGYKLQPELYLNAISEQEHKTALGAFYMPAKIEYETENDKKGMKLQGFMNSSDDSKAAMDKCMEDNPATWDSDLFYIRNDVRIKIQSENFLPFLDYGKEVAKKGTDEMAQGYIAPSPKGGECEYCQLYGCCNRSKTKDAPERTLGTINPNDIGAFMKKYEADHKNDDVIKRQANTDGFNAGSGIYVDMPEGGEDGKRR